MDNEEKQILLTALDTIQASINVLEMKMAAAEKVLAAAYPGLYSQFQIIERAALLGPQTASAQMLELQRRKILRSIE